MQLINCKVELELKSMKHSILASPGNENTDANSDNITIIRPCCCCLSKRLTKGFQRFVWWKRYKTKSETRDKRLKVIPEYLLDYEYIKNYYKLIVVDLSKQK